MFAGCCRAHVFVQKVFGLVSALFLTYADMQGFEPDDFVTGQRRIHPDMAQPGPGRGTDWDSMFG